MTFFEVATSPARRRERTPRARHYVMTPPTFFAVEYAINPWMDIATPVDAATAVSQWEHLYQTYLRLGHNVELVQPLPGLPDMVYAANGGLIVDDTAIVPRFAYAERAGEEAAYAEWMAARGHTPVQTHHV